jgi:hypothetical protein
MIPKADTERTAVGCQGGKGKAPPLHFRKALTQFALVAYRHTGLFQRIQKLVK